MINVSLTGRLTRDPELRQVAQADGSSVDVCEVRVAAHDSRGRTVFLDCVQWGAGGRAAATLLSKGSPIAFSGEMRLREASSDGTMRRYYSAVGRIEFIGETRSPASAPVDEASSAVNSDAVPF